MINRVAGALKDSLDPPKGPWPSPHSVAHVNIENRRHYRSLDGAFEGNLPGVTTVLKILGLSKEPLVRWAANEERKAVLTAANQVYTSGLRPQDFVGAVEAQLGQVRQHQRILEKSGDIGSEIHRWIDNHLQGLMGEPSIPYEPSTIAIHAAFEEWLNWWNGSGLKPVRMEQPAWSLRPEFCGTIDLIAEAPDGFLEVWDWKTTAYVYPEHHVQLAAYVKAANNFAPCRPGGIVKLPKKAGDKPKVVRLGEMTGGKTISYEDLLLAFEGALTAFKVLC